MFGSLLKIAVFTIRRAGIAAILFLTVGMYMILPALEIYFDVAEQKSEPNEITAVIDSAFKLDELLMVSGVKDATSVLYVDGTVIIEEYYLSLKIEGIDGAYLDSETVDGIIFPESSNMPYIILNKAALESFTDKDGKGTEITDVGKSTILKMTSNVPASICGIIDDGIDEPKAYMSYYTAKKLLSSENKIQSSYEVKIRLEKAGAEEKVVSSLRQMGYKTSGNYEKIEQWELLEKQMRKELMAAFAFVICAAVLLTQNIKMERITHRAEYRALRISGITKEMLTRIIFYRLMAAVLISLMAAVLVYIGKALLAQ